MNDFDYYKSVEAGQKLSAHAEKDGEKLSPAEKIWRMLIMAIVAGYFVLLIAGRYFLDKSGLFYRSLDLFSEAGDPDKLIRIISYALFFYGVSMISTTILKRVVLKKLAGRKMSKAVISLISNLTRYATAIATILLSLNTLGVDTLGIVAGLGILSLIIGMGTQELVGDIVAGLFIVFEQLYDVGDIILVDGFRGTVRALGIRTTQIEDEGGNVQVVNNSALGNFINMTAQMSIAQCEMLVSYQEDLKRVEEILHNALPEMSREIPELAEGPFYVGISDITESGMSLSFIARCEEGAKYRVERAMKRCLKLLFDEHQIQTPYA